MDTPPPIPKDATEWRTSARSNGVANTTINNLQFKSASKFQFPQYLSLRALVKPKTILEFNPVEFGLKEWVKKASAYLKDYESWQKYCKSFDGRRPQKIIEGSFALPRFYQKQVYQRPREPYQGNAEFNVVSPVSKHTRSQMRARGQESMRQGVRQLNIGTPSRQTSINRSNPSGNPSTPGNPIALVNPNTPAGQINPGGESATGDQSSSNDQSSSSGPSLPESPMAAEFIDIEHPKSRDEQIVNTALIDFLNAFVIHRPSGDAQWTLHRMAFGAFFAKSEYEARTDGYLEDKSGDIHAIVEVKPFVRRGKQQLRIVMQEAAQIVAWIKHQPDNDRNFTNGR